MSYEELAFKISNYTEGLKIHRDVQFLLKKLYALKAPIELFEEFNIFELVEEYARMPEYQGMARRLLAKLRNGETDAQETSPSSVSRKRSHGSTLTPLNMAARQEAANPSERPRFNISRPEKSPEPVIVNNPFLVTRTEVTPTSALSKRALNVAHAPVRLQTRPSVPHAVKSRREIVEVAPVPAKAAKKPESSGPRGSVTSLNKFYKNTKETTMIIGKSTVVSIEKFQKTTTLSVKDQLLKIQLDLLCTNLAKSIQLRETFQGIDVLNPPHHMLHQARILTIPLLSQPIDRQVKKMATELIEKVEQKKTTHSRFLPNPHSFFIKIAQDIMDHPENADQIKEKYQMDMLKREQLSKRWDGKTRISFDDEEPMAKRPRNRNY